MDYTPEDQARVEAGEAILDLAQAWTRQLFEGKAAIRVDPTTGGGLANGFTVRLVHDEPQS